MKNIRWFPSVVKNLFRIKMVALSVDFAFGEKYTISDTEL